MSKVKKTVVLDIAKIQPNQLKEFQGWEEKQLQVVKENPFVAITDTKSFEAGKKARTNLRTARTTLEKQDKDIASALAQFRKSVGGATAELIKITAIAEETQQEEVKRYEDERKRIAEEKALAEKRRVDALREKVNEIWETSKKIRNEVSHDSIDEARGHFKALMEGIPQEVMAEESFFMHDMITEEEALLDGRIERVIEDHARDLEKKRLEEERLKQEEEKKKLKAEREEREREERRLADIQAKAQVEKEEASAIKIQSEIVMHLSMNGWVYDDKAKSWKKDGLFMLVEPVPNQTKHMSAFWLRYESVDSLKDAISQKEEEKKMAEERAKKQALALKKIDAAKTEVALEEAKNIQTDAFIFPNDLGIDKDIIAMGNQLKKIAHVMTEDIELHTETIMKTWNAFSNDMNKIFVKYTDALKVQEVLKGEKNDK